MRQHWFADYDADGYAQTSVKMEPVRQGNGKNTYGLRAMLESVVLRNILAADVVGPEKFQPPQKATTEDWDLHANWATATATATQFVRGVSDVTLVHFLDSLN